MKFDLSQLNEEQILPVNHTEGAVLVTAGAGSGKTTVMIEKIADLVKEQRINGISDLRDESDRDGMRIVIEHRRDVNGQILLNQLYKYSQLEDTCAINMLALVNNEPKILSLPQILDVYIDHQKSVIYRRVEFDLDKAKARAHIFEGYHIAIDNIDRIVEITPFGTASTGEELTYSEMEELTMLFLINTSSFVKVANILNLNVRALMYP